MRSSAGSRLTLLNDDQVENAEVLGDDAAAHGLSPSLTLSAAVAPEAGVAWSHEEAHTAGHQHSLLHGETLLVLASHDLEDVPLELLQQRRMASGNDHGFEQCQVLCQQYASCYLQRAKISCLHRQPLLSWLNNVESVARRLLHRQLGFADRSQILKSVWGQKHYTGNRSDFNGRACLSPCWSKDKILGEITPELLQRHIVWCRRCVPV